MLKPLLARFSPAGARARLSILIFHRVLARPDPLFPGEPDAARFDAVCGWLARWFQVLPLDQAVQRLADGSLPERAAAITFDDGYADNHDQALPILQRHGLPATFFIACGFLDGGRMWNDTLVESLRASRLPVLDLRGLLPSAAQVNGTGAPWPDQLALGDGAQRRAAIDLLLGRAKYLPDEARRTLVEAIAQRAEVDPPDDLMMRSDQVQALHRAGMQIGAHTMTHPILARLADRQAADEMARSRDHLQQLLQAPVPLFAYPNGRPGTDYTPRTAELARELGFAASVTTGWGAARQHTPRHELPRFTPWDAGRTRFGLRLLRNLAAT